MRSYGRCLLTVPVVAVALLARRAPGAIDGPRIERHRCHLIQSARRRARRPTPGDLTTLTPALRRLRGATRPQRLVQLLALLCVLWAGPAVAQSATAPELKAAFLYNFAKLTEWPTDVLPAASPLVLCVAGDSRVLKALDEATRGREIDERRLVVREMDPQGPVESCHLLYVDDIDAKRAVLLIERVKDAPVLSLSDFDRFADLGGSAHLFVEDGRMRFAVNLGATQRSKLRLSSRLLSLAKIVKDDSNGVSP